MFRLWQEVAVTRREPTWTLGENHQWIWATEAFITAAVDPAYMSTLACLIVSPSLSSSFTQKFNKSKTRIYRPIKGLNWSVFITIFRLDTAGAGHRPTLCSHLDLKLCCKPWSAEQEHKSLTKLIKCISSFAANWWHTSRLMEQRKTSRHY